MEIKDAINQGNNEEKGFRRVNDVCSTHTLVPPKKDIDEAVIQKAKEKVNPELAKPIEQMESETREK